MREHVSDACLLKRHLLYDVRNAVGTLECVSTFYIVGKAEKQAIRRELKVEQSAVSIFYIVGKAEKQAKRWELKVGQSALARFRCLSS